jgi:hypothetical protein
MTAKSKPLKLVGRPNRSISKRGDTENSNAAVAANMEQQKYSWTVHHFPDPQTTTTTPQGTPTSNANGRPLASDGRSESDDARTGRPTRSLISDSSVSHRHYADQTHL